MDKADGNNEADSVNNEADGDSNNDKEIRFYTVGERTTVGGVSLTTYPPVRASLPPCCCTKPSRNSILIFFQVVYNNKITCVVVSLLLLLLLLLLYCNVPDYTLLLTMYRCLCLSLCNVLIIFYLM